MAYILCLETATSVCSVALSRDDEIVSLKESDVRYSHSALITPFIQDVIRQAGISLQKVDAIAVSKGPGSYTGLRIGVSTAKGLCYALDLPLVAIGTLQSLAYGMIKKYKVDHPGEQIKILFCPMIDARRMEVYDAIYTIDHIEVKSVAAEIIREDSFTEYLNGNKLLIFGDNAIKCKPLLTHQPDVFFTEDFMPSASYMVQLALQQYNEKKFEDLAYFEPFYLKDFIAGKPHVKGLK
jgi:tRNA threonylcarbamoyladenosine biosynthesis protein TsaB